MPVKHVGLHNAQKVTIILHQMNPPDEHMCLLVYDEKLPSKYFDLVHKAVLSKEAQEAKNFADILENVNLDDNRNLARVLFQEGHFKKVPANLVFATPFGYNSSNKIKLNELNEYTNTIEKGGEALKKMQELDEGRGLHRKRKLGEAKALPIPSSPTPSLPLARTEAPASTLVTSVQWSPTLLTDPKNASEELRSQGDVLRSAASQLLEQAKILADKAEKIFPTQGKRGRGRPKGTGLKVISKTK